MNRRQLIAGLLTIPVERAQGVVYGGDVTTGVSRSNDQRLSNGLRSRVTPWDFGDITGDPPNDTALIELAAKKAQQDRRVLYFPAGEYGYQGEGLPANMLVCHGDGADLSKIFLSPGCYLFRETGQLQAFHLEDVQTRGGQGVLKSTFVAPMVHREKYVLRCKFRDYTRCAIETNTTDGPYWKISNNEFYGVRGGSSIGIALSGLCDEVDIAGNDFASNKVGIKLGRGGINALIDSNSFLRFSEGEGRVDIWLVLSNTTHNFGDGLCIDRNKFGNENMNQFGKDFKILCADEEASIGASFGDRLFSLAPSLNRIGGFRVNGGLVANRSDRKGPSTPLVFSTTGNLYAIDITQPPVVSGTPPTSLLAFRTRPELSTHRRLRSKLSEPRYTSVIPMLAGSGYRTPVGISHSGRTATVRQPDHRQSTGSKARIVGAKYDAFNGTFAITVIDQNSYTYTLPDAPKGDAGADCWAEVRNVEGVIFGEIRTLHAVTGQIFPGQVWLMGPQGGASEKDARPDQWGWRWSVGKEVVIRSLSAYVTSGTATDDIALSLVVGKSARTAVGSLKSGEDRFANGHLNLVIPSGASLCVAVQNTAKDAIGLAAVLEYEELF